MIQQGELEPLIGFGGKLPGEEQAYALGRIERWSRQITMAGALSIFGALMPFGGACPDMATFSANGVDAQPSSFSSNSLNIGTYNIASGKRGIDAVTEVVRQQGKGIVCLQETTTESLAAITDGTAFKNIAPGWALFYPHGAYGDAVVTELPIKDSEAYELPSFNGHEQRVVVIATLEDRGQEIVVAATHLTQGTHPKERKAQTEDILGLLKQPRYQHKNVALCGDFNSEEESDVHKLLEQDFVDGAATIPLADNIATFPFSQRRIDYIWLKRGGSFQPVAYTVSGGESSDHCMATMTVQQ